MENVAAKALGVHSLADVSASISSLEEKHQKAKIYKGNLKKCYMKYMKYALNSHVFSIYVVVLLFTADVFRSERTAPSAAARHHRCPGGLLHRGDCRRWPAEGDPLPSGARNTKKRIINRYLYRYEVEIEVEIEVK